MHQICLRRFGDKEHNEDFKTEFSDYNNHTKHFKPEENLLNKVWYERERVFLVDGTPKISKSVFWVPVDKSYYKIARKLKNFELNNCESNTTICLPRKPSVVRVRKGVSANVFVNNKAFRDHLKSKFDATPTDMESAAVALVCYQHKLPFIAFRAGSI
ncbi:Phosphorylase superfamily protein [Trifolium repens]|nr:Phosphorylase superfamily protein [Trifolium repens]